MKHAVGVDLGGTKIEASLVNEEGKRIETARVPTEADKGWQKVLENLEKAVSKVQREDCGIGIGTPGFIHNDVVESAPNVPCLDKVLHEFKKKHPAARFMNDANCFALAEHKWGAARNSQNAIGLIWGTGIGAGIIMNGELVEGASGGAGEVGHVVIDKDVPEYEAGGKGTWEQYCSGPNIVKQYKEAGGDESVSSPAEIMEKDDELSKSIIEETVRIMGIGLGNLVNVFNPDIIVLGGGVSNLDLYEELNAQMKKYSLELSGNACRVVKNELGDSAGVLGATALVFEN